MKSPLVALVALFLAGCGTVAGILAPTPDTRLALDQADMGYFTGKDTDATDKARADAANARAAALTAEALKSDIGSQLAALGAKVEALGATQPGTPWGAIAASGGAVLGALGGIIHSIGTRKQADANSEAVAQHDVQLAALGSPKPAAPAAA